MSRQSRARHRFSVAADAVRGGQVYFQAAVARQMRRVLRLGPGDRIAAFDGRGVEYTAVLISLRDEGAVAEIEAETVLVSEPGLHITLYQALLPRGMFEHTLQKATEVGVSSFVPLGTERSLIPATAVDGARLQRWQRILEEATEQSGRASVPQLGKPLLLPEALAQLAGEPALLAWEREKSFSIRQALTGLEAKLREGRLVLFVGPEGGFTSAEAQAARDAGVQTVSLGPRILRAETAGPVVAALALYQAGDMELA
jgi:16S rRNA (uracil1498-N3)-methyltransferase